MQAKVYVQTWSGTGSVLVIDMTDAHKRGKRCRVARFTGWSPSSNEEPYRTISNCTCFIADWAKGIDVATDFDTVRAELANRVRLADLEVAAVGGGRMTTFHIYDEDIRAIDAPRPKLTAGVPGSWAAEADEDGITIDELGDSYNEPCCITPHDQSKAQAYKLAAKVWAFVQQAKTFSEAQDVLRAAGCKLHYYCRVD